jgi:hypothetical protein
MTPVRSRSLLAGLLLAVFGISVLPGAAAAGPKANLNQVQRQVDQLNRQAEQAAERYNTAKVELTDTTRQLRAARNKYAATQRRLDAMKVLVGGSRSRPDWRRPRQQRPAAALQQPDGVPAPGVRPHPGHQAPDHLLADMQSARLSAAVDRKRRAAGPPRPAGQDAARSAPSRASWPPPRPARPAPAKQRLR